MDASSDSAAGKHALPLPDAVQLPEKRRRTATSRTGAGIQAPLAFRLLRTRGVPAPANAATVTLQELIHGDVQAATLYNYMFDLEWLYTECPQLQVIPVTIVHGERGERAAAMRQLASRLFPLTRIHAPPLPIQFGTHHTKMMVRLMRRCCRACNVSALLLLAVSCCCLLLLR